MMKNFILFLLSGFLYGLCSAQMLTPTVVASGGEYFFNAAANASLSTTIGEMTMVETFAASSHFLTQGFQQPEEKKEGIWVEESDYFELFEVFPNPASDRLNVRYKIKYSGNIQLRFFDMNGVEVLSPYTQAYHGGLQLEELDVSVLSQGMYFLQISFDSPVSQLNDFQFHKINIIR